ncbi:MAG TPA: hypothetical protein VJG90_09280 [Candidatus Nanoarchaeia archaeon]|nr:hypothetical protein [Candidatus Nanoarchaeia archaeon]
MPSFVRKCEGLDLEACIEFQGIFALPSTGDLRVYSPFEYIKDPHTHFPLAIMGELGGVLNAYSKTARGKIG